jgi:hypothetical protein
MDAQRGAGFSACHDGFRAGVFFVRRHAHECGHGSLERPLHMKILMVVSEASGEKSLFSSASVGCWRAASPEGCDESAM